MEETEQDKIKHQLKLNMLGVGTIKTKNHGEINAKVYKSYVEFSTLLGELYKNKLGVEITYKCEKNDLLKTLIENALKKEWSEENSDYRNSYQHTLECILSMKTTRDLELTFTDDNL